MAAPRTPAGLQVKGARLWREMHALTTYNPAEMVMLEEACRIADRLDRLHAALEGGDYLRLQEATDGSGDIVLRPDSALNEARQQANQLKQLVAALRLPDEKTGERPQHRGGARGAYSTTGAKAKVSSLERFRAASAG